ncbi:MAG: peptidoglycan-binding protein [Hormoscilla sp. GUM202]|nr:peptidoglycan-binding protein [Hormoscilla sp. GUM202]
MLRVKGKGRLLVARCLPSHYPGDIVFALPRRRSELLARSQGSAWERGGAQIEDREDEAIVTATLTPLQSAGNSPEKAGWLDSYFGPVTELAVIKFQRDNQLRPDGVAGPQTQNLLLLRNQQILKLPNSW